MEKVLESLVSAPKQVALPSNDDETPGMVMEFVSHLQEVQLPREAKRPLQVRMCASVEFNILICPLRRGWTCCSHVVNSSSFGHRTHISYILAMHYPGNAALMRRKNSIRTAGSLLSGSIGGNSCGRGVKLEHDYRTSSI
jgi:hypothetical protein